MFFVFRRHRALRLIVFGAAFLVLNLVTIRYLTMDDIDKIDLGLVSGHRIAIDAGHGGIDNGASGNGIIEKNLNLAIAIKLSDLLRAHGAEVTMIREDDRDFYTAGKGGKRNDLLTRISMLDNSGAELFVSIHANALRGGQWSGAQVFYSPRLQKNKLLGEVMQRALRDCPPGNRRQAKSDSDILILNRTLLPGVLVETGFITSRKEAAILNDPSYQDKLAGQIAKALAYYLTMPVAK